MENTGQETTLQELLSRNAMFGTLPVTEIENLTSAAKYRWATAGECIVTENEAGDEFFLVTNGSVSVTTRENGAPVLLAELSTGDFFGEVAVLKGKPRTATVTAIEDVELFVFTRQIATDLAARYPSFKEAADQLILNRSVDTIQKLGIR